MMTQAVPPPQPYKFFGAQASASAAQGQGASMLAQPQMGVMPPRLPMQNIYAQFNQFKHINVPPPNMSVPPPTVGDPNHQQQMVGLQQQGMFPGQQQVDFDAKRQQRKSQRRTVDYNASVIQQIKNRVWRKTSTSIPSIQPDVLYYVDFASPKSIIENPVNAVTTRFVRTATNKIRCPIFSLSWTPEGRRLITGSSSGEFTLWGGLAFNFETVLQAHESAVRTMEWSHNDTWLLTADHNGCVKYWQSNMNNVKTLQAHNEPVRGVGFSPTDNKFASCSDDGTVKIWDFYRCQEERVLRGHGADVKCLDWHPSKGLLVSGSKDSQQPLKLWDPKSGASLSTIHMHKSTVMDLQWNRNGDWLLTASRDHLIKVFDIRAMKEIQTFRGHKKEATAVDWHPVHESLFASGGSDGAIMFWNMGSIKEVGSMDHAHDAMIWSVRWHPLGNVLASGSNDHTCKFWTRNRPGDKMKDKYNLNTNPLGDDDYEYDIPTALDSSDLNKLELNSSALEENVPGLAMGSASSSSSLPVPKAEGIPGIDMQFPSAEKIKEQQEAKQKTLQSARQSGFKLPNLQLGNNGGTLNIDAPTFQPSQSNEVKVQPSSNAGNTGSNSSSGVGLLPTPDKSSMLVPRPNSKGVFDPFVIQSGFVIEALEVWVSDKAQNEDFQGDNKGKKRTRRPEIQGRGRFSSENRDNFSRGFNQNQDEFGNEAANNESENQEHNFGWREPPDKRQMTHHPAQGAQGPPSRSMEESNRMRPPPGHGRGRPPSASDNQPSFDQRINDAPFQGESHSFGSKQMHKDNPSQQWNNNPEAMNRLGGPSPRGRGHGFPSMQRPNLGPGRIDNQKFFVDEFGNKKPNDKHAEPQWRGRGQGPPNNGFRDRIESKDGDRNWEEPGNMPQHRGPRPLMLRGYAPNEPRRFPPPNGGRPMFDGPGPNRQRPPNPRQGPPTRQGPPHSQNEPTRGPNVRPPNKKMLGLMDNLHSGNDSSQWQGERTGAGR